MPLRREKLRRTGSRAQRAEGARLCEWRLRHRQRERELQADSLRFPLSCLGRDGREKCCALIFFALHPHVAAVDQSCALGDGKSYTCSRSAIRRSGRAIVAIENTLTIGHGDNGAN